MSDAILINSSLSLPMHEMQITASRSSGPGGQHVNTTDSRIQLRWNIKTSPSLTEFQRGVLLRVMASRVTEDGDLILACDTNRSQRRNREEALQRLASLVRTALIPPKPRKKTRPTRASREKRLDQKRRRSAIKKGRSQGNDGD
jgi:ribosome-associated protein